MLKKLISCVVLCLTLSACASYYGAARIQTVPAGAQIISDEDGSVLGVTPDTLWWKQNSGSRQHIILRFQKDGYYDKVSSFWLSMSETSLKKAMAAPQDVEVQMKKKDN